jgi:hypothetical protein
MDYVRGVTFALAAALAANGARYPWLFAVQARSDRSEKLREN